MEQYRITKTQRKSVLSRHINTLKRLLIECDIPRIIERLSSMRDVFDSLEEAHYGYLDSVIGDDKIASDVVKDAETWFEEIGTIYSKQVSDARVWLTEHGVDTVTFKSENTTNVSASDSSSAGVSESLSKELVAVLNLPKIEIPSFNGDPLEYYIFISLFDQVIGSVALDDQCKLMRLLQYLSGDAAISVKHCILLGGTAGYFEARKILETRFGNSHLIVHKIIDSLKNGGPAVRGSDLRKLADDVTTGHRTLAKLGAYGEINNQQFIQDILLRCHGQIRGRWRKFALDTFGNKHEYPPFEEFVKFLNRLACEACDPVYGYDAFKVTARPNVNTIVNSSIQDDMGNGKHKMIVNTCILCQDHHFIAQCGKFKSMTPDQRSSFVKGHHLCFGCLSSDHMIRNCTRSAICKINGCNRRHSRLLHSNSFKQPYRGNGNSDGHRLTQGQDDRNDQPMTKTVNSCSASGGIVYLPLIPVIVNGCENAMALLDSGSSCTLMTERLVDRLHLKSEPISCELKTIGSGKHLSKLVSFNLQSINDNEQYFVRHACVISDIPADVPASAIELMEWEHLKGLPFSHLKPGVKADIIIGMDNAELLIPHEVRRSGKVGQPYATLTKFGWVLQGPVGNVSGSQPRVTNHVSLEYIDSQIKDLWSIEDECESECAWSVNDRNVYDKWSKRCVHDGVRFTIPPPWKPGKPYFPCNLSLAKARLQGTLKRLAKLNMRETYHEGIVELMAQGHAEQVPDDCVNRSDGAVWYLPHHAVFSDSKPGKLRIVFDCAAKCGGVSLNSECYKGPDMTNKLLHVLLRFRQHTYAVTADIRSMYLQVRIPIDDRDCLRFLWSVNGKIVHLRMTSHLFGGIWCASSSAYALQRTLEDFGASSLVHDAVTKSMYVDDLLRSLPSKDEMSVLIHDIKLVLNKGGFPLTKFIVNDPVLLSQIPEEDRAQEVKVIASEQYSKALGIKWEVSRDQFSYVRKDVDSVSIISKRHMLSSVAAMYDPLGLLIPIIILGRMLFQEATRERLMWDDPISQGLSVRWLSWWDSLNEVSSLKFDRCVVPREFNDGAIELHHFCDGSQLAYGVCTYVRILSKSGSIHVQLLMSKARLTPINPITIPRTELCAAVMAVKVDEMLHNVLELHLLPSVFWTDSQVVLHYIKSDTLRFRVFVANRVSLVRSKTRVEQWHHVPSKCNPADVLSRGCIPRTLPDSWTSGPDFLHRHRDSWPKMCIECPTSNSDDNEVKKDPCVASIVDAKENPLDKLISHYSDFYRLRRALAWLLRWRDKLRVMVTAGERLSLSEVKRAEDILIRRVQSVEYSAEIECLVKGKPVKRSSHIASLDPILVDGKIAVGGRLKHANLSFESRHPVILPPRHGFAKLVLRNAHNRAHLGPEWVLSQVRQRFWIPGARNELRGIRRICVTCQKLYGRPGFQKMADLPVERCSSGKVVFSDVGCDLFGTFFVVQGRSTVKRYGCVFTCLATRAIHLEVLHSLETDAFLNGFHRFCARRGNPKTVRSDRGTNLVGACTELAKEFKRLDKDRVITSARRMDVDWSFNPPTASHYGGVWERMIRTVRKILLAVMPVRAITDDVLSTTFCEVENLINGRPLTKCSSDVCDDSPLTPNHFLLANANYPIAWSRFSSAETYRRRWKLVQNIVVSFWKRWIREYLPDLQRRQKWLTVEPNFKVGDLALLMDESSPRGCWPLGRVVDIHIGRDGNVRCVRLNVRGTELVRPISKLIHLELD